MKEQSIENLLQSETKKRLEIMEQNDYEFPERINKVDIIVIIILVLVSIFLIAFCMMGVMK